MSPPTRLPTCRTAESLFKSTVSVRFLAGIGKLKDDFRISFAGDKKVDKAGNYLLDLVPVKPEEGVKKLQVAVNRQSFQIVKVILFDPYGNVTTLSFSGHRTQQGPARQPLHLQTPGRGGCDEAIGYRVQGRGYRVQGPIGLKKDQEGTILRSFFFVS